MTRPGRFHFEGDDKVARELTPREGRVSVFLGALSGLSHMGVSVLVETEEQVVPDPDHPSRTHTTAPVFDTQWFSTSREQLKSRGLEALDEIGFDYDAKTADREVFPQFPGGLYDGFFAPLERGQMRLSALSDGDYRLAASGDTEFGWHFDLETRVSLSEIVTKSDQIGRDRAPDPEVEAEFDRYFDRSAFDLNWVQTGTPDNAYFHLSATPRRVAA